MSKKKKKKGSKKKSQIHYILLATAILQLIQVILEIVKILVEQGRGETPTLYKRIAFFKLIVNIKSVRGGVQMTTLSLVVDILTAIADVAIIVIVVKDIKK